MTKLKPPILRKERKISVLTLYFPVTANIGTIGIYRLDASGFRLIRVLHGCKIE
jgi:hypothetical protein